MRALIATATLAVTLAASQAYAFNQVVPAYFPLFSDAGMADWKRMCDRMNPSNDGSIAVVNPASGPFTEVLPYVTDAVAYCQGTGNNVIGYVSTRFGNRSVAEVKIDIDRYYSFYPKIDGIFLDEMATDPAADASCDSSCGGMNDVRHYYTAIKTYVNSKARAPELIGNMGTAPPTAWMLDEDVVTKAVIFEGSYASYAQWTAPTWVKRYRPSDFVHLVYGIASTTEFTAAKARATANRSSQIYFTDQSLADNPWDALSIYWPQN